MRLENFLEQQMQTEHLHRFTYILQSGRVQCMIISYDFLIYSMTTISVPLPAKLLTALEHLIDEGCGRNKADVMRRALEKYVEDQAVEAVLKAEREPRLYGNLRDLAKRIR